MEIVFKEITEFKTRFGRLLSFLFNSANLQIENISSKLVESPFLDMLEENQFSEFLSISYIDALKILFPEAEVKKLDQDSDIGPIYWAGIQYMNIFLNYRIPLRQIFLFCPLDKMIQKYPVYHEMNEIELCKDFMTNEYGKVSILRYFRNKNNLSVRQLSMLINVPEPTLKYLESDNKKVFGASYNTISLLRETLNIDKTFFKDKSEFIPFTYSLLSKEEFAVDVSKVIGEYIIHDTYPDIRIRFYKDKQLDKGRAYLFVNNEPFLYINGKQIPITDSVFRKILILAVEKYINENLKTNLVF